jgi:pheromone a factor receptor
VLIPTIVRTIRLFNKRRSEFKDLLSANKNLNSNRYFRLMFLAGLDLCTSIPISIYIICVNVRFGLRPWISWSNTHLDFDRVTEVPALLWRNNAVTKVSIDLSRGLTIACALIFFGFFGFAAEARKNYRRAYLSISKLGGDSTRSVETDSVTTTGFVDCPFLICWY